MREKEIVGIQGLADATELSHEHLLSGFNDIWGDNLLFHVKRLLNIRFDEFEEVQANSKDALEFNEFIAVKLKVLTKDLPHSIAYRSRPKQIMPAIPLDIFVLLAGRGFGKTFGGSQNILEAIESKGWKNIAIVGQTVRDTREVMMKSKAGILNQAFPWNKPEYKEAKGQLIFPNGAICHCYSGDKPGQLRGPEHHGAWMDEPAKMMYANETMEQVQLGLRLGALPQLIISGTPRPIKIIKDLVHDAANPAPNKLRVVVVRGSTYENKANLSDGFIAAIEKKFKGTRMGRQEIDAEILDDNIFALFQQGQFDKDRVDICPTDFVSIVIGVDPATTDKAGSDATGIVAVGRRDEPDGDAHYYLLRDRTQVQASPNIWAQAAIKLHEELSEEFPGVPLRIVGESNQGGQMVADTIHSRDDSISVELVHASKAKRARAEPISALHEQGRVHPVGKRVRDLEDECSSWEPDQTPESPNRLDAMVWAIAKQAQEQKAWGFVRPATHKCVLRPMVSKVEDKWVYELENGPGQQYHGHLVRAVWLSGTGQSAAVWAHIAANGWWLVFDSLLSKRTIPTRDFMSQVVAKSKDHFYKCNVISGNRFNDPIALDNYRRPQTLQQEIAQMDPSCPLFHNAGLVSGQDSLSVLTAMLTARLATSKAGKNDPYWQVIGADPNQYLVEPNLSIYPDEVLQAIRQAKYHSAPKGADEFDIPEGLVNDGGALVRCLRLLVVSGAGKELPQLG